ncbi:conserved Plasmodium protein, unknown function [Babesia microti strain RI]|uniref:Uncharacterized protein n=1 Tax=Babesia microti (strain RI) TaxID=1133968 RepID=I7J5L1_BABMR|nr:conserved Plasmodium protein, unknown function [Babesia microti strain RI]CCF72987.1 conserved Plasmodium protein, unknown function [Babesia microti strain RI]|eukprot:XP_012647596.1 conserved Plasmodium protein, unknown function [Babesia microti strain RI]
MYENEQEYTLSGVDYLYMGWGDRPYTAPLLRDLYHTNELHGIFSRHVPFSLECANLHVHGSNTVADFPVGNTSETTMFGGCSSTLNLPSLVPLTTFGDTLTNKMRGTDIFFMPKPSQLLPFALPVFVFMPNLTVFFRQWFFYGPK